jgi:hypothetical protein
MSSRDAPFPSAATGRAVVRVSDALDRPLSRIAKEDLSASFAMRPEYGPEIFARGRWRDAVGSRRIGGALPTIVGPIPGEAVPNGAT